jgi:hypothetical protein
MIATRDLQMAQRFRRWRRATRWCLAAGLMLLLVGWQTDDPIGHRAMIAAGALLFVAVFPLYLLWCNRCPRCGGSFSKAAQYASDETSGLPLFNSIARCPFCQLDLDDGRRYL